MSKKYLKVFILSIRNNTSLIFVIKNIFECFIYFFLLDIVFKNIRFFPNHSNTELYLLSAVYLLIIFLYKFFNEKVLLLRYLIVTDNTHLILLKPINPLYKILIDHLNFVTVAIIILLIVIAPLYSLSNIILIISGIIISLTLFVFVLSLSLITNGELPLEKLLLLLFLLGFFEYCNLLDAALVFIISIVLLFASFRFWKFTLTKYTSVNS